MGKYEKRKISSTVDSQHCGYRIDNYLSERFDYHSRNEWQNIIKEGNILLNKTLCKPSKIIKPGDEIEFNVEDFKEPDCNLDYKTVYEDDDILAVNKPCNCIIHPVGPFFRKTLTYKLEEDLGYPVFPVNRLDRETTGLVLLAKKPGTAKTLSQNIADRKVYKEYYVGVHGIFPERINSAGYLLNDINSPVRKKRKFQEKYPYLLNENDFEFAETDFELIQTSHIRQNIFEKIKPVSSETDNRGGQFIPGSRLLPDAREYYETTNDSDIKKLNNKISLVKVNLKTGRLHQIRATLCSLGFPVIGDKIYGIYDTLYLRFIDGNLTSLDRNRLIIDHQALHAYCLIFSHPSTDEKIEIKAELPGEIKNLFPDDN
ncbi:MAG: RluA family pseudouridine synthase [Victivallales bacterium]|nr:RluA family pseudouridine synthase [Victivallales bacterium]